MTTILKFASESLLMDSDELMAFALSAPHRYKKYIIRKRSGNGFRLIAQPAKEVKFIQRLILVELRKILPVHGAAMAYEKNVGIKLNASHHKDNAYILKMDFREFFPSITPYLFFLVIKECGLVFSEADQQFLSRILFFKHTRKSKLRLSIGAPTSPFISNFVMFQFDTLMAAYCNEHKINYTRYADDITFSTNTQGALFEIPTLVKGNLRKASFGQIKINSDKTVFSSKAFNRHVTGVVISNDATLSLGHEKKRLYSAMIHRYSKGGLTEKESARLKGLLAYSIHIEPDFIDRMRIKYSGEVIDSIMSEGNGNL